MPFLSLCFWVVTVLLITCVFTVSCVCLSLSPLFPFSPILTAGARGRQLGAAFGRHGPTLPLESAHSSLQTHTHNTPPAYCADQAPHPPCFLTVLPSLWRRQ